MVSIALSTIYYRHSRFSIPLYTVHLRPVLALHIFSGLIELLGLHLRPLLLRSEKIPDLLDLILCFAQSGTNMALVKNMSRGQWRMTRPSYQAGAILRPVLTISAIVYQRADLHTSSLQIIHAFIYTRCLIYICWKADLLEKHSDMYMMAVFAAAILAMADTPCPAILSKAYVLCVAGISLLNHWASHQIKEPLLGQSKGKGYVLSLLLRLGFVDLPTLEEADSLNLIVDDYCDGCTMRETKAESQTEGQKAVDRVSHISIYDKTRTLDGVPIEAPSMAVLSPKESRPTLCFDTDFLVSDSTGSEKSTSNSEEITIEYFPVSIMDQISTRVIIDSRDIKSDTDHMSRLVTSCAQGHEMGRAKRWRSLLSLRNRPSTIALTNPDHALEKLKPGSRVLIDELEVSDDGAVILESKRPYEPRKAKRVLLHKMLGRFKEKR
jgi:hypothetical protein